MCSSFLSTIWSLLSTCGVFVQSVPYFARLQLHTRQAVLYVRRHIEARSCNRWCSGRAMSITCCECVFVALGIQHAMRMRRIILPSVACPALQNVPHYLINGTNFGGKKNYWTQNVCFWSGSQITFDSGQRSTSGFVKREVDLRVPQMAGSLCCRLQSRTHLCLPLSNGSCQ
jgi:hypothetical protein